MNNEMVTNKVMKKKIKVPAEMLYLDNVLEFIILMLSDHGCSVKLQRQIMLVVEEIFCNIVSYAYPKKKGCIIISCKIIENVINLMIIDNGYPFNPLQKEDPDLLIPAETRDIGGFGIYLVKKTVDYIDYKFKDGRNVLVLTKIIA